MTAPLDCTFPYRSILPERCDVGFFNWAAPLIRHWGDRWTPDDAAEIGGWLRPHVPAGGHVLDVGGGSGQFAVLLADALETRVTVLDPTPQLIAHVPTSDRVSAVLGNAEDIPFDSDSLDAIFVSDAFHHFRDQDGAVREFARVVRPGGAVLVLELDPTDRAIRWIARIERLVGEPGAFLTPEGMCAFMADRGVDGTCERVSPTAYYFLGEVVG